MLRTAYLLCYDAAEAEDLVQETWAQVARRWQRVGRAENPSAYARRVLINLAIDSQADRGRRRTELTAAAQESVADLAQPNTDSALHSIEHHDQLAQALAELTARQRAVLVLRYWDDLSEEQTADLLGCSIGTVKSTASKALARLRTDYIRVP